MLRRKILFSIFLGLLLVSCGNKKINTADYAPTETPTPTPTPVLNQMLRYETIIPDDFNTLYSSADLIVVGTFIEDDTAFGTEDYDSSNIHSTNVLKVERLLKGDLVGDTVTITCQYGLFKKNNTFLAITGLTPMEKGTAWVYFLGRGDDSGITWAKGDYAGRYSLEVLNNMEKYEKDLENGTIDYKAFGLYEDTPINFEMYKGVYDMLYQEE